MPSSSMIDHRDRDRRSGWSASSPPCLGRSGCPRAGCRRAAACRRRVVMTTAPATLAKPMVAPSDRSMPAMMMTKVCPIATASSGQTLESWLLRCCAARRGRERRSPPRRNRRSSDRGRNIRKAAGGAATPLARPLRPPRRRDAARTVAAGSSLTSRLPEATASRRRVEAMAAQRTGPAAEPDREPATCPSRTMAAPGRCRPSRRSWPGDSAKPGSSLTAFGRVSPALIASRMPSSASLASR